MVKLSCAIAGLARSVFSVKIDTDKSVAHLKDAIKATNPTMIRCDATHLQLFLAKESGAWLDEAGAAAVALDEHGHPLAFEKMMPSLWLKYFGEECRPEDGQVHVLVVVPNKRRCLKPVEDVENFPQIDIQGAKYVTLPAELVEKCGLRSEGDLTLYCRPQVHELWAFLRNEVIVKNARGFILGPSGTGKSVSTLSFAVSLDHHEWNVVWIHLCEEWSTSCPRGSTCSGNLLLETKGFLSSIYAQLREDDRLVICSSMSALGHRSLEADRRVNLQVFVMYSWTQDEYLAAIADQVFYSEVMDFFVATNAFEVNDEGGDDVELSDDDTKKLALALKFYYAGGSCRFMFQYPTEGVKTILERAVHSAASKADLVKYCNGAWHTDSINRLYGMQPDSPCGGRFPMSSYAAALLAKETGPDEISWLMNRLNASNNRAVNGHLLEWLFLAATPQRSVELVGTVENILTRAKVLQFDPKKPFKTVEMKRRYPGVVSACHPNGTYDIEYDNGMKDTDVDVELLHKNGSDSDDNVKQKKFKEGDKVEIHFQSNFEIQGNWKLLQPVAWYQGSYDMLYFSTDARKVTFIQVARSDKLHLKMRYFHEVLLKLDQAGMIILVW